MTDLKIVVLGAGVIGLTTALELKKEFRNISIDLIASKFYDETTSFAAAGLFSPNGGRVLAGSEEKTRKWITDSYNYWNSIRVLPESQEAGVRQLSGYYFTDEHAHIVQNEYMEKILPLYRAATEEELKLYPGNWKFGTYFTTLQTAPTRYLKWALNKASTMNIRIIQETITSFQQLKNRYDVVVNCTGIGARFLCDDPLLVPVRGQVSVVNAPWIKKFVFGNWDAYIIPSFDNVILGGCRQLESYNTNVNQHDAVAMEARCASLIPSLKTTKLVGRRVGLRPHRLPIRIEKEYLEVAGDEMKIVHNYGHGGDGVTLAPGTALNAVQLVREMLIERRSKL